MCALWFILVSIFLAGTDIAEFRSRFYSADVICLVAISCLLYSAIVSMNVYICSDGTEEDETIAHSYLTQMISSTPC